jgi:hypothetical protein
MDLCFLLQRYKIFLRFSRISPTMFVKKCDFNTSRCQVGGLGYLLGTSCLKRYPLKSPLSKGVPKDLGTWVGLSHFPSFFRK